jgi:hypothetical protein
MTRSTALALPLALAACSSDPPRNEATAAPSAPAEVAQRPAAPRDSGMAPRPGVLKTFGDWTVGCDNTLACELRSLAPEGGDPQEVTVSIASAAGPGGRTAITIDDGGDAEPAVALDGRPVTGALTLAAMVKSRILTARVAGQAAATVSLKGAAAALRYVDAVQGRAGTTAAFVARGPKPASAVPAPPAAPTIVALTSAGTAPLPSADQLAAMRRTAECESGSTTDEPSAFALGGGKTLILLPCSAGAYNQVSAVFVLDRGGVAPVKADAPLGFTDDSDGVPGVVNGEWKDGVLSSYAKGRGIGDCGVIQQLVWDGARLRLAEQREMGECRGNADYIRTWRATVVRR